MLPFLPTYLVGHGITSGLVGIVMASFYGANVLVQIAVGPTTDRIGVRSVLSVGIALFVVCCVLFPDVHQAWLYITLRALQGAGSGAISVACAACVGVVAREGQRGRAFGAIYGGQAVGFGVGPLVGSLFGSGNTALLFTTAGLIVALSGIPVVSFVPSRRSYQQDIYSPGNSEVPTAPVMELRAPFIGGLIAFASVGCLMGVYETVWSLLLNFRHASHFEVGLSWTCYAIPFALLAIPAGRLADRMNRRVLVTFALLSAGIFASIYPSISDVHLLIGLTCFDAIGAAIGIPAILSVIADSIPLAQQGRAQGIVGSAQMATTAAAAAISGFLFEHSPGLPFYLTAVILGLASVALVTTWRPLGWRVTKEQALAHPM